MPSTIVATGVVQYATRYYIGRNLVRKSNGDLWCVYVKSDGVTNQIYCAYSKDNGTTWAEEKVTSQTSGNNQGNPTIAVDSNDDIHISWTGLGWGSNPTVNNIQYRKRTVAGWQAQETISDSDSGLGCFESQIAIDDYNKIHIIWGAQTALSDQMLYRRKLDSWQPTEVVADRLLPTYQGNQSMVLDSLGNVHFVWGGKGWGNNPGAHNLQYRKRTTSWQAQESLTDEPQTQSMPKLLIDSKGNLHLSWYGKGYGAYPTKFSIQYKKKIDSWSSREPIVEVDFSQYFHLNSLDAKDNFYAIWSGTGWGDNPTKLSIQCRKRNSDGSWDSQAELVNRPYDQLYVKPIFANYPVVRNAKTNIPRRGFAFVWSGWDASGYTVEYFYSDDLKWSKVKQKRIVGANRFLRRRL